jgi:hypothetical protein
MDDVGREIGHGGSDDPGKGRLVLNDLQPGHGGTDRAFIGHDIAHAHDGKSEVMTVKTKNSASSRLHQVFRHREVSAQARDEKRLMPPAPTLTDHFLDVFPAAGEVGFLADEVKNAHAARLAFSFLDIHE